jgi:hypothetical protein
MDIVHPRVAGIDVHKKIVWVASGFRARRPGSGWSRRVAVRDYGLRVIMCSRQRSMITNEGRGG